ncbi:hypothetical protein CDV36_016608 [Fusarium kuroshium]|uniref:Uncharacterized protein n=1 Tax=Fusarium kuroshium TaxID=2010991 RepID=A0A3M2QLD1_9HYPO|nr:hypothetical protein CDV36_016608 [Fusarium kuroshium]
MKVTEDSGGLWREPHLLFQSRTDRIFAALDKEGSRDQRFAGVLTCPATPTPARGTRMRLGSAGSAPCKPFTVRDSHNGLSPPPLSSFFLSFLLFPFLFLLTTRIAVQQTVPGSLLPLFFKPFSPRFQPCQSSFGAWPTHTVPCIAPITKHILYMPYLPTFPMILAPYVHILPTSQP